MDFVSHYYSKLKALWSESVMPNPCCNCPQSKEYRSPAAVEVNSILKWTE